MREKASKASMSLFICPTNSASASFVSASETDAVVAVDRSRFRQIVLNLLKNAVEAVGPEGRVDVNLSVVEGAAELVVRDHDAGFDHDLADRHVDLVQGDDHRTLRELRIIPAELLVHGVEINDGIAAGRGEINEMEQHARPGARGNARSASAVQPSTGRSPAHRR